MASKFNGSRYFFDCPPNCEGRKPGCQDHCKRRQEQKAEWDKLKAADRQRRDIDNYVISSVAKKYYERVNKQKRDSQYRHRRHQ